MSTATAEQLQPRTGPTGPRTAAGKAAVARNGLKSGMTARSNTLLPGEDPAEFEELLRSLHAELAPDSASAVERALIDRLANAFLRMQRSDQFVHGVLEAEGASEPGVGVGKAFWRDSAKSDGITKALRYGSAAERSALMLLHELQRLRAARQGQLVAVVPALDVIVTGPEPADPPTDG